MRTASGAPPTSSGPTPTCGPAEFSPLVLGQAVNNEDFKEKLEALNEQLEVLNAEARELEERIAENVAEILETT